MTESDGTVPRPLETEHANANGDLGIEAVAGVTDGGGTRPGATAIRRSA